MVIEKGNHVVVPHGTGVVVGFERFDPHTGHSLKLSDKQIGNERIAVQLDEGHTWPNKDSLYYVYKREIKLI